MTGETLSHYRLLERIGEGATSVVYKAEDLALGRPVALKLLPPGLSGDFGVIARFQHEARTTSSLTHPNICTIYETGEHEGRHFIVMEYLEGQVLSKVISGRPLDAYRLLEIAIQIADGLAAAHAELVIHQDIKPANIYVTQHDHVKLLDFGLAVLMPANFAERGSTSAVWLAGTGGTAPYMSPEQTYGEQLDTRSDLFSFGVTLYEMATGRRPFTGGTNAALMDAIRSGMPQGVRALNPSAPEELDRIIEKALEKNRKLRYQTASDMGADLRRLKRDLDSQNRVFVPPPRAHAPSALPAARPARAASRPRVAAGAAAAAAAVVLIYAGLRGVSGDVPDSAPLSLTPPLSGGDVSLPPAKPAGAGAAETDRNPAHGPADGPPGSTGAPASLAEAAASSAPGAADAPGRGARAAGTAEGRRPDREWAREQLAAARSKVALELYDQAIGTLEALLSKDSSSDEALDAYLLMASIHEIRDRRDDAISTYLDIATRYPESARTPEALVRMADALLKSRRRGREAEALKTYTDVASRYASSPWAPRALMTKGGIEERMDLHQRDAFLAASVPSALVTYRQLAEGYPASAERETALWKLSQLYQRIKRYDLAAAALEALGESYPSSRHDGWFAAAEIYDKRLKQPLNARSAYARVPTSSPKFEEAQKRLDRR